MTDQPTVETAYWAFISYSSADASAARWLQKAIETYEVPRRLVGHATVAGPAPRRLRPIFRDRTELPADSDLTAKVREALAASAYLIVICSPQAVASRWVNEEIRIFRDLHGESRILAMIVAGSPTGDYEACFPAALRFHEGTAHPEPIAADLRPGGDGRRAVKLKLVAGMLGVGLDELARRDAQRRARQFGALAAASFAGAAVMTALAGVALLARNEAVRQRGEAEGLIGFMLGDLDKRLDRAGRLDLMDGIGPRTLDYYARQDPATLNAVSLSQRAEALRLMGQISEQRGHMADALRAYEAASATTGEQMARAPNDGQRIFDHAQSVFYVGEIAYQRAEWAKAEAAFQTYLALATRLTRLDPKRDDWRLEVGYAQNSLGALYLDEGRDNAAVGAFGASLLIRRTLAAEHPADVDDALALGQAYAWLADGLETEGHLGQARADRQTQLALYASLLARDPTLTKASFSTIPALRAIARIDVLAGNRDAALAEYRTAAARAEALRAVRPDDMDLASEVALAEVDLGDSLLSVNDLQEADARQKRAQALVVADLAHGPPTQTWRSIDARASILSATIDSRKGDHASALRTERATLANLEADPPVGINTESRWLLDRARLQTGDDLAAIGRVPEARAQWSAMTADLSGPLDRYEPRLLLLLEDADNRLGRTVAARDVSGRLSNLLPPAKTASSRSLN